MTTTLDLDTYGPDPLVLTDDWVTVRSGASDSTLTGSSTSIVVTVTATPTPDAETELRVRSRSLETATTAKPVTGLQTVRMSHTADTADVIELQARRTTGTGGLMLLDVGALQGADVTAGDEPDPTETGIVTHPQSTSTPTGVPVTLSVVAVGQNLSYQWEVDTGGGFGNTGTDSPNLTTATAGDYRVTVTGDNDPVGGPVVSNTATLTVTSPTSATIVTHPAPVTVVEGSSTQFGVAGSNIVYVEFRYRIGGSGDGTVVFTSATGSYTTYGYMIGPCPLSWDGREYAFWVYGPDDVAVKSNWALLTVEALPTVQGATITDIEREAT